MKLHQKCVTEKLLGPILYNLEREMEPWNSQFTSFWHNILQKKTLDEILGNFISANKFHVLFSCLICPESCVEGWFNLKFLLLQIGDKSDLILSFHCFSWVQEWSNSEFMMLQLGWSLILSWVFDVLVELEVDLILRFCCFCWI